MYTHARFRPSPTHRQLTQREELLLTTDQPATNQGGRRTGGTVNGVAWCVLGQEQSHTHLPGDKHNNHSHLRRRRGGDITSREQQQARLAHKASSSNTIRYIHHAKYTCCGPASISNSIAAAYCLLLSTTHCCPHHHIVCSKPASEWGECVSERQVQKNCTCAHHSTTSHAQTPAPTNKPQQLLCCHASSTHSLKNNGKVLPLLLYHTITQDKRV